MSTHNDDLLYGKIDAKLADLIEVLPVEPDWSVRWRELRPDSSQEVRLAVYQDIRDSGLLPEDAGFYLVAWQIDAIASHLSETALRHLDDRLAEIEAEHGLGEDEVWEPDEAPAEYQEILREYDDAWDQLFADQLAAHGEHAIAELVRVDYAEYERRNEAGRQYFHGEPSSDDDVEAWLEGLIDHVGESLTAESPMGPLGIAYRVEEGFWEVDLFATPVELVGGADDGALLEPGFSVDLDALRATFDRVEDFGWNAHGWPGGGGPFVWVEGTYQGRELCLRVLAWAPEGEAPRAKLRVRDPDRR